jgi:hypothetical protein
MRLLVALSVSFALAAASSPARSAALAAEGADARCLLAMVALSNSTNPNDQAYGQVGVVYFMGRIAARDPGFDFASLRALAGTMDAKSVHADLQQSCSPMFQKSMAQLADALAGAAVAAPR